MMPKVGCVLIGLENLLNRCDIDEPFSGFYFSDAKTLGDFFIGIFLLPKYIYFKVLNYLYVEVKGDCKNSSLFVANFDDFWELHLKSFFAEYDELPNILGVYEIFFLLQDGVSLIKEDEEECFAEKLFLTSWLTDSLRGNLPFCLRREFLMKELSLSSL